MNGNRGFKPYFLNKKRIEGDKFEKNNCIYWSRNLKREWDSYF